MSIAFKKFGNHWFRLYDFYKFKCYFFAKVFLYPFIPIIQIKVALLKLLCSLKLKYINKNTKHTAFILILQILKTLEKDYFIRLYFCDRIKLV